MSDSALPSNLREFHCTHCNGKIRIPRELPPTTGPCPHCHGTITSPAPEPAPSSLSMPAGPVAYGPPAASPALAPLPGGAPAAQPAAEPSPPPAAEIPGQQSAPPASPPENPEPLPQRGQSKSKKDDAPAPTSKNHAPIFILTALLLAFAAGAAFIAYKESENRKATPRATPPPRDTAFSEQQYLRIGWQKEAYGILEKFLAATTVEGKLPYILNGDQLKPQVEAFYGGSTINDLDTPADAFSVFELAESDTSRGIFLLTFFQPQQFEMKEFFRPLATLEVQYGLNEADILLSSVANVSNFASEPVRVSAFFKRTPEGLKLDWETFVQTKYRTFENFTEVPESGQSGVFRVILSEDVPEAGKTLPDSIKTYRVWDPSSPLASKRVNVSVDSPIGRALSEINWRGNENRASTRSATLELKWVGTDQPRLEISRFICWEFLHLGGSETASAVPAQ